MIFAIRSLSPQESRVVLTLTEEGRREISRGEIIELLGVSPKAADHVINSLRRKGMVNAMALKSNACVEAVYFTRNSLVVDLKDGRTISAPLLWYPKLLEASGKERGHWEICGGGYGIHWPDIDEDISIEGLLRGAPAPSCKLTT